MANNFDRWSKLTSDTWVLQTVSGYKIEFSKLPYQNHIPKIIDFGSDRNKIVDQEVLELLQKGAISECNHESGEFISNIFLVQKKGGKFRPVINLKKLNTFIQYHHFKMENIETVLKSISRNHYFMSFDLQNAYFSVPIHPTFRKFLKFQWDGKLYCFNCVCFGLSCAPFLFSKIMKVIFSHIRRLGISAYYYIDDSLLEAESYVKCQSQAKILRSKLTELGFYINTEKSCLIPTTRIVYLGHVIDSVEFKVFLPLEKIEKIIQVCNEVLSSEKLTIRKVAQLVGLFTSSKNAIRLSRFFYRYLSKDKVKALLENDDNFDALMKLSLESQNEIKWWLENVREKNGSDIRPPKIEYYLETDSSKSGWGAAFQGENANGRWTESEAKLHINILEIKAVYFALLSLCRSLRNTHLCVKCDNSTAVAYVNKGGSILSLNSVAKDIWLWCEKRNIHISAVFVSGVRNIRADFLSRHFSDSTEWKLHENVFLKVCQVFFQPDIDLFASRINKQLSKYVSWFPEPDAFASDAFSLSWSDFNPYLFPPFSLVSQVLQKIKDDQVRKAVLIVPMWATQPWFPLLLHLLISVPKMLPNTKNLLRLVHNNQNHPLCKKNLYLVACSVSGLVSKVKVFQNNLSTTSVSLGENLPLNNTTLFGTSGIFGVTNGKLIPYTHLKVKF